MNWFSRALNREVQSGTIKPFVTIKRAIPVSHLLFADDILIFCNGNTQSLGALMQLIEKFCILSGEKLNPEKSQVIMPAGLDVTQRTAVTALTKFSEAELPLTYLGAPLYKGRTLKRYFQFLEDRVRKRIYGWAGNLLSTGGKVELVRSVLSAMGIHAMLTLPIPLGTLDNMGSLMAAFIWDSGGERRKHWVSWGKMCLSKVQGGLNVRSPRDVMYALHGKRAWEFISGNSLWARFARSHFKEGKHGSPLWNSISPLLPAVRRLGNWRIGNGMATCGTICSFYGRTCHSSIRNARVKNIIQYTGLKGMLLTALPAHAHTDFENIVFSDHDDSFICSLTKTGEFSTKLFYHLHRPSGIHTSWGQFLWRNWIPSKISFHVWKIFHKALPTDDNIRKLSIPIASKCTCCRNSTEETILHLFFRSETAVMFWRQLGSIFDRNVIAGPNGLTRVWLQGNKTDFMDCLATMLAVCGLWELWKARNAVRHDDKKSRHIWREVISWANNLYHLIHVPFKHSEHSAFVLQSLSLPMPRSQSVLPARSTWKPPDSGFSLSTAIYTKDTQDLIGGVVRDSRGQFKMASAQLLPFGRLLTEFKDFVEDVAAKVRTRGGSISIIQSSYPFIASLTLLEDEIPTDEVFAR